MENNPFPPSSYEGSHDDEDDSGSKKDSKKSSKLPWRMPFPASELHGGGPKTERTEETKSFIGKVSAGPAHELEKSTPADAGQTEAEPVHIEPHPELASVDESLWQEFDNTPAAAVELPASERPASVERPVEAGNEEVVEQATPVPERPDTPDSRTLELWDELDTLHLNERPRTHQEPAAAEPRPVSETSPASQVDQESQAMWEELNNAPPAEVPEWHPDSADQPRRINVDNEFANIMAESNVDNDFVEATSGQNLGQAQQSAGYDPMRYTPPAETEPYVPPAASRPPNGPSGQPWYPGGRSTGTPMLNRAAEAAVLTGAAAGMAPHAAEAVVAGAAAGAATGAVAGGMMANRNRHQMNQLKQENVRQSEQISTMATEQQQTAREVEDLKSANQKTAEAQQWQGQESREAAIAAAAAAAEAAMQEEEQRNQKNEHEVSSEWHTMVVNSKTGKLVDREGVNQFGQGLIGEQLAEKTPKAQAAAGQNDTMHQDSNAAYYGSAMAIPAAGYSGQTGAGQGQYTSALPSGQVDTAHELPTGTADSQHMLPVHKNPVTAAVTSPLLWAGVAILIAAFFAAALL